MDNEPEKKLQDSVQSDVEKIDKQKRERSSILGQTVFLGTLGLIFVIPVVALAYLGVWLDDTLKGFSVSWTISLIFLGIVIGAINVYLFIKERDT